MPALTLEAGNGKPDVTVRGWRSPRAEAAPSGSLALAPDGETVATFTLDPQRALHVDWHGQLIAAVEILTPRHKDRLDCGGKGIGTRSDNLSERVPNLVRLSFPLVDEELARALRQESAAVQAVLATRRGSGIIFLRTNLPPPYGVTWNPPMGGA
ncbi:MAG: hypothetical protein ACRELG_04125 [Gemmataceae bacterium]